MESFLMVSFVMVAPLGLDLCVVFLTKLLLGVISFVFPLMGVGSCVPASFPDLCGVFPFELALLLPLLGVFSFPPTLLMDLCGVFFFKLAFFPRLWGMFSFASTLMPDLCCVF